MGIPRKLRYRIYEFVWCSPGYPEAVAFPYPPKEPTEESVADGDDEDDWEDEPERVDFSASEEDEV
jgi:hypothetical protein